MRQGRIFLSFLLTLGVVTPVSAIESTLIDFTTFNDNIAQVVQRDQELYDQVIADRPELDIRSLGYPDLTFEASDWNLDNWRVILNPSSDVIKNQKDSVIKNSPSKEHGNVLGVRIKFNPWDNSFWGKVIMPYFLSPTYVDGKFISQDENFKDNGMALGLLVNVGQIKNVKSWVYGLNYDYTYGVRVRNDLGQLFEFGMGSVRYDGWRRAVWNNELFIDDIRFIKPTITPLYPNSLPYVKFDSLMFYKPFGYNEPNFIGYVKDVTVEYDFAVLQEERDIDNEAIWNILSEESIRQRIVNSKRVAEELSLRKTLEQLKNANDAADAEQADGNAAAN